LDQQHFDEFYEEVFTEMERKYGPVEELNVKSFYFLNWKKIFYRFVKILASIWF